MGSMELELRKALTQNIEIERNHRQAIKDMEGQRSRWILEFRGFIFSQLKEENSGNEKNLQELQSEAYKLAVLKFNQLLQSERESARECRRTVERLEREIKNLNS